MRSAGERLLNWARALPRGWLLAGTSVLGVIVIVGSVGMYRVYDYVQHDNNFCVSCHLMVEPFQRFETSAHRGLSCKACHRPNIIARSQMALTQVLERPDSITHHAEVPRETCAECHVDGNPDEWKLIANSVGHRIHLEAEGAGKRIECVDCHGAGIHEFAAVDRTCGQSACHEGVSVRLGKMSELTIHCTACHDFNKPVARTAQGRELNAQITPRGADCFSCHAMRERTGSDFPVEEAHGAVCGTCHNPHDQAVPQEAVRTCASGGCHTRADTVSAMHRGLGAGVMQNCTSCHKAHSWAVAAEACTGCHAPEQLDGGRIKRIEQQPARMSVLTAALLPVRFSIAVLAQIGGTPQPFRHNAHKSVACKACHSTDDGHGTLKIRTVTDCSGCHHAAAKSSGCQSCHASAKLEKTFTRTFAAQLTVAPAARSKTLTFAHATHTSVDCRSCHKKAANMRAVPSCETCHESHHTEQRSCTSCHTNAKQVKEHTREAHLSCAGSGCHQSTVTGTLQTQRNVCLACHTDQAAHEPAGDCADCHMIPTKSRTSIKAAR